MAACITTQELQAINLKLLPRVQQLCDELWQLFLIYAPRITLDAAEIEPELDHIRQAYEARLTGNFFAQMQVFDETLKPDTARYRQLAEDELDFVRGCETETITTSHNVDQLLEYILNDPQLEQFDMLISSLQDRFLDIMTVQASRSEELVPSSANFDSALERCEQQIRKQYAELHPRWQRLRKCEYQEALAEIGILQNKGDTLLLPETEWQLQLLTGEVQEKAE